MQINREGIFFPNPRTINWWDFRAYPYYKEWPKIVPLLTSDDICLIPNYWDNKSRFSIGMWRSLVFGLCCEGEPYIANKVLVKLSTKAFEEFGGCTPQFIRVYLGRDEKGISIDEAARLAKVWNSVMYELDYIEK